MWYVAFDDAEPADSCDRVVACRIVRVVVPKPVMESVDDEASNVSGSRGVD